MPPEPVWEITVDSAAPPIDEDAALDAMAELLLDLVEKDRRQLTAAAADGKEKS
jgi:hypothetical protein